MGLFGPKESMEEITNRVRSSECGRLFANAISTFFTEDDTHYHWLMANSKDRMYTLEVFKNGVRLGRVEVSRTRLKETGTYDVDAESWGFGASEYSDLPNSRYVDALRDFIFESIKNNCPNVQIVDNKYIKLNPNVMKGW